MGERVVGLTSEGVQCDMKAANEQWVLDSPVKVSNLISKLLTSNRCLSTVLAQDHFFSDFLSLHMTIKNHTVTMMMFMRHELPDFFLSSGCRLDDKCELGLV